MMRWCVCVVAAFLMGVAHGDTLFLNNGDRLTGNVLEVRDGTVTFETGYAGTLTLSLDIVTRLETETARAVRLEDGTTTTAALQILGPSGDAPLSEAPPESTDAFTVERDRVQVVAADEASLELPIPSPWSGSINTGVSLRSGNTDTFDFHLDTQARREKEWHTLTLKAGMAYGETDETLDTRRYKASARWQYYPRERLYLYLLGGIEGDDGRKLDLRLNAAAGLGYDFIDRERTKLSGDLGLEFVHEEWAPFTPWEDVSEKNSRRSAAVSSLLSQFDALANGNLTGRALLDIIETTFDIRDPLRGESGRMEEFANLRAGLNLEKQLFQHSTITNELIVYPNLQELGELRLTNELALATPLTEKLNARVSLLSEFDSQADESGVKAWDNTLRAGLQYNF